MSQKQRKGDGSTPPETDQFSDLSPPDVSDVLKKAAEVDTQKQAPPPRQKRTKKICHCGEPGCNIGPFVTILCD